MPPSERDIFEQLNRIIDEFMSAVDRVRLPTPPIAPGPRPVGKLVRITTTRGRDVLMLPEDLEIKICADGYVRAYSDFGPIQERLVKEGALMTIQLIRKDGRVKGFAFFFGDARLIAMAEPPKEYWRICECCYRHEALVFCRTHAKYVCGNCLGQLPSVHTGCNFISVAVARDLALQARKYAEVEAYAQP